jgi:hypothetical protein
MEIHALKLIVSEQDLTRLASQAPLNGAPVRDLAVRITPEGVSIRGKYQAWVSVAFDTLWHTTVQGGKIRAQLTDVKVVGMPAAMVKGMLMDLIAESLALGSGLQAEGEILWIDLDVMLAQQGFPARTNLTAVHCALGLLTLESGLSPLGHK